MTDVHGGRQRAYSVVSSGKKTTRWGGR